MLLHNLIDVADAQHSINHWLGLNAVSNPTIAPAVDVVEKDDSWAFSFDIPGVKQEDTNIELTGNRLLVTAKREEQSEENHGNDFLYKERVYGEFKRSFTLPENFDPSKISATLEDGVLTVSVGKNTTQPQNQKIAIEKK